MPAITITGFPGSGKTKLGENIAEKLGYKFYSVGNFQGMIATDLGITINELMEEAKANPELHIKVDQKTIEIAEKEDDIVIEGWLAPNLVPWSYKIFLTADERTRAERIFKNQRHDEIEYSSIEHALIETNKRFENTCKGFKKAHGIIFPTMQFYNDKIDNTYLTFDQTLDIAYQNFKKAI